MYLGDGCISRGARTWHLRITLDTKYPGIIDGCCEAIEILMPGQRATIVSRKDNCVDVVLCSNHWPCLFPQQGPGRKHHRRIALEPWQEAIVKEATEDFVRGLIHSDGCRVVADDRGVKSIRLSLHESLGRHPRPLHLGSGPSRHPEDTFHQIRRLDLPKGRHRPPRRIHRPQSLGGRERLPRHVDQPVLLVETELGMAVGQCDPQAFRYLLDLGPAHITPSPHTAGRDR